MSDHDEIRDRFTALFIDRGLLVRNSGAAPEVTFEETELTSETEIFGNVADRLSGYAKRGTLDGGRISAMAWDDEREGLAVPDRPR